MENPMRLRSRIKKVSEETGIPPDVTLHMYVMERFIARLAMSSYRDRFILKGGFLLYARHGLRNRTTSDIDLTSKTESVEQDELRGIIDEICSIDADDDLEISLKRMSPIAEVLEHPGIRAFLVARFTIEEHFYVDVVPSPTIVPDEIEESIPSMFDDEPISVMAYRTETVIAEKLHAAVTRKETNTRMRDFYDFYVLEHEHAFDDALLRDAAQHLFSERGTLHELENGEMTIDAVRRSPFILEHWKQYCGSHRYAADLSFDECCESALRILAHIKNNM